MPESLSVVLISRRVYVRVRRDYVEPGKAPEGFQNMGGTAVSPIEGLFNGRNILTFQVRPRLGWRRLRFKNQGEDSFLPAELPLCVVVRVYLPRATRSFCQRRWTR